MTKDASIKGKPSKLHLDTKNLVLVTNTTLYVFNYDLMRIYSSERDMTKKILREAIVSNHEYNQN